MESTCWPVQLLPVTARRSNGWQAADGPGPGSGPRASPPVLPAGSVFETHCGGSSWGICCLRGLETPRVSPQSSANRPRPASPRLPRLSCCWQVLVAKNSSGGDSSLGLQEGDESGEGRQLHSQTRWRWSVVGGECPPPRPALTPAANCLRGCLGGGHRPHQRRPCQARGCAEKCPHPRPGVLCCSRSNQYLQIRRTRVCGARCQCRGARCRPGMPGSGSTEPEGQPCCPQGCVGRS